MRLSESWIQLNGTSVIDQSVGILPLIETLIAFGQEFLRISITTSEKQHRKETEGNRYPRGWGRSAGGGPIGISRRGHGNWKVQFCALLPLLTS